MSTTIVERGWDLVVPHHAQGARTARQRLTASLSGILATEVVMDAVAVVSELVGNAVRHAQPLPGGVVRVAWRLIEGNGVEIRVTDGGSSLVPEPRNVGPDAVAGRGLTIVEALSDQWGSEASGVGRQCVWARLCTPA